MSFTGKGACPSYLQSAVHQAVRLGSILVAAAGNMADDAALYFPANCEGVINVGATTIHGAPQHPSVGTQPPSAAQQYQAFSSPPFHPQTQPSRQPAIETQLLLPQNDSSTQLQSTKQYAFHCCFTCAYNFCRTSSALHRTSITSWQGLVDRALPEQVGSVGIGTGLTGLDWLSGRD